MKTINNGMLSSASIEFKIQSNKCIEHSFAFTTIDILS